MNLHRLLQQRAAAGRPVRVGLIGAGKFGSMFLAQVPTMPGSRSRSSPISTPSGLATPAATVGWDAARIARTAFVASGVEACADPEIEVVVEATGSPPAGIAHARAAIAAGKHIVMVNVEADVLAGPLLAEEARARGVVYSLAYGDQPALTCELVDWARACGFEVVAAGKGTKYLPAYHAVTPDEVWGHYGLTPEEARRGGMNPQMFNSFLDGTKSAIEMAAIANACGLAVPRDGLAFPPCGVDDLPQLLRATAAGGVLERDGMVEVVSSLERDGRPVFRDLRWGVYVVLKAPNEYARACFKEYGLKTDASGWYAAMYKPYHLIGLELGISVLSAALRGEPTGQAARLSRRRRRRCQARIARGRDARRRGRLYSVGQARAGRAQPGRRRLADRSCAQSRAAPRYCCGRDRALGRCRLSPTARRCGCGATWSSASQRHPQPSPRNRRGG